MEFTKAYLNQLLKDETHVALETSHLHSGPRLGVIFEFDNKFYRAFCIDEKGVGGPRWYSMPNSDVVDCEQVARTTKMIEVVTYVPVPVDIDTHQPTSTPFAHALDYHH